jgi:hypothetical protein
MKRIAFVAALLSGGTGPLHPQLGGRFWPAARTVAGGSKDGSFLLTTGWRVRPAGRRDAEPLPLASVIVSL